MAAAQAEQAQKRKLGEEGEQVDAPAVEKHAAITGPLGQAMRNEDFSPELLRIYYERLFPFQLMVRWLSYSKQVQKDYFLRREFTFVLQGDIFCRYQCFKDVDEFRQKVLAQQPIRMEIGAVNTHPPKNHHTVMKDAYKPVERELVFDIDMDDYDPIRTCCQGSKMCPKCWTFMKAAIKVLRRSLEEDFGFKHIMFVYSGRRGVHCWVCDKEARTLSNERRAAVAEYLNLVASGQNRCRADIKMNGCSELHPSVEEAHRICLEHFRDGDNSILEGQEILKNGPHLANILEGMPKVESEAVSEFIAKNPEASSKDIWMQLEKLKDQRVADAKTFAQKREAKVLLTDIVIQYTYPRLDINVSKQMNHLLKAPFVVHPKTGRVCVPILPEQVDTFDPFQVPTIGRLVEELNRTNDPRQTSLKEFTKWFEHQFLEPHEKEMNADKPPSYEF
jgi:DNA primase small subunit